MAGFVRVVALVQQLLDCFGKNPLAMTTFLVGAVEGQNKKAKVVIRKSYGFKTTEILKIPLYHKLGKRPIPKLAHKYF